MKEYILQHVNESVIVKQKIFNDPETIRLIEKVAIQAVETYKKGGKLLLAGNGGSAADAQHIAGELVSRFYFDRPGLSAEALTTNTSILTAIGNDYGYDLLFRRQVQALARSNDLFIGISTSGNSENIVQAILECKVKGIKTVAFTGFSGGRIGDLVDYCIRVPSEETPRIQESHILIGHIICAIIEKELFSGDN